MGIVLRFGTDSARGAGQLAGEGGREGAVGVGYGHGGGALGLGYAGGETAFRRIHLVGGEAGVCGAGIGEGGCGGVRGGGGVGAGDEVGRCCCVLYRVLVGCERGGNERCRECRAIEGKREEVETYGVYDRGVEGLGGVRHGQEEGDG